MRKTVVSFGNVLGAIVATQTGAAPVAREDVDRFPEQKVE